MSPKRGKWRIAAGGGSASGRENGELKMGKKGKATSYIVLLITFKDLIEARRITAVLLNKRLAACCNLVGPIESSFWWEGKIQRERETLAVIKTKKSKFDSVIQEVKARHSYQVPEIIALPVLKGDPNYLQWLREVVI